MTAPWVASAYQCVFFPLFRKYGQRLGWRWDPFPWWGFSAARATGKATKRRRAERTKWIQNILCIKMAGSYVEEEKKLGCSFILSLTALQDVCSDKLWKFNVFTAARISHCNVWYSSPSASTCLWYFSFLLPLPIIGFWLVGWYFFPPCY